MQCYHALRVVFNFCPLDSPQIFVGMTGEMSKMSKVSMKSVLSSAMLASLVILPGTADAARSFITNARVIEVRNYGAGNFGSCVAQINRNVNTDGDQTLTCGNQFLVSFGCDGQSSNSRAEAQAMFSTAQLALVTGNVVDIYINDGERYNQTMCVGEFIFAKNN